MYNTAEITWNYRNILLFAEKYFGSNDKINFIELLIFSVTHNSYQTQYIFIMFFPADLTRVTSRKLSY